MTVLADSDVLIEVTRGRNQEVLRRWTELSTSKDAVLCSVVSVTELWHGARPREYELLTNLFSALRCIPVDHGIAWKAGEFLRAFHKSHNLELADALIAASAVSNGAALWTRNEKHYPMSGISLF